MIAEEAISLEEDSSLNKNDLHSLYTSIKSLVEAYIKKNNQSLNNKIEKLTLINDIITTIISSDKPISFEKIDSLIKSLKNQIALLKQTEENNHKEIALLKDCLQQNMTERYNGSSLEDTKMNRIKRKLKNKEIDYQLKELNYLFCINDQSKRIKELQKKKEYNEDEIKYVKLFPSIVHTTETGFRSTAHTQRSKTNVTRNMAKMNTVGNSTNYSITNKKMGIITEGNEDFVNEKGFLSERSNREQINQIMQDNQDLKEAKSNTDVMNYKLYQKNRLVKQTNHYNMKNTMLQISNLICNHNKSGYFRTFNPLMKKPIKTYYGSFK